jgi:hypothetical protein
MGYRYAAAVLGNEAGRIRNKIGILGAHHNFLIGVSEEEEEEQQTRSHIWCIVLLLILLT